MKTICRKCGRKISPLFYGHIFNGHESIVHGNERVRNGTENIRTGREKEIKQYVCPFCGTYYKNGLTINE